MASDCWWQDSWYLIITTKADLISLALTEGPKIDGNFWAKFVKPVSHSFPGAVSAIEFSPIGEDGLTRQITLQSVIHNKSRYVFIVPLAVHAQRLMMCSSRRPRG